MVLAVRLRNQHGLAANLSSQSIRERCLREAGSCRNEVVPDRERPALLCSLSFLALGTEREPPKVGKRDTPPSPFGRFCVHSSHGQLATCTIPTVEVPLEEIAVIDDRPCPGFDKV